MPKNKTKTDDIAPDALIALEDCAWGCQFNGTFSWNTGDIFIPPPSMPDAVFQGMKDNRQVGPKSMLDMDYVEAAVLAAKAQQQANSEQKSAFKKLNEEAADQALKEGGKISSFDGPVETVSPEELQEKIDQVEKKAYRKRG